MSKIIRTEKPSVLPFYAAAAAGLVLCLALPVYQLWALALMLVGAAAAFLVARRVCPPQVIEREVPFHTGSGDVDQMLTDIQQKLDTLHALNDALPDPQLSAAMDRMERAGRSIVEVVEASPAKAKQIRRFANYYLPDAVHVLEQYAAMARQGVRGENAASVRTEVERNMGAIAAAFEHQLDALYASESMDLSADLAVLECNYEPDWLRTGPYPYYLKARIAGDRGHLSNEEGAWLARTLAEGGTRRLVLAHLSKENNTPARAMDTVCRSLSAAGICPEADVQITVAPRDCPGQPLPV